MSENDCVFCKISLGEIKSKRIYENDNFFSIHDVNPQVKGHSLVISKKHFKTTLDLPSSLGSEFLDCVKKTVLKLTGEQKTEGFNLHGNNYPSAGQVVHHFHIHVLPRKEGDWFKICV